MRKAVCFILFLVVFTFFQLTPTEAQSNSDCVRGLGNGSGRLVSPTLIEGMSKVKLGGKNFNLAVTVQIMSMEPQQNGTLLLTTAHSIIVTRPKSGKMVGTMATIDRSVFTPTGKPGEFSLHTDSFLIPEQGTGMFAGSPGTIDFDGLANIATGQFSAELAMRICNLK